jgi:[CysO sulfur-carrier protein]-S-L-cysteine hydrolase
MIKISFQLLNQLMEYCRLQLPSEACGAFLGSLDKDIIEILNFIPITNIAKHPSRHFEFNREQLLELLYTSQKPPWIGIFHSHPLTAAYPSAQDLRNLWHLPVYAILSFAQSDKPIIKSYEILTKQQKKPYSFIEQAIEITMDGF